MDRYTNWWIDQWLIIITSCISFFSFRVLALIVENTFTSIPHIAQLMVPGASSLPRFFYKNKMNNNFERYVNFIVLL